MSKAWKNYILSSGLPLENDVINFLLSKNAFAFSDYTYLKPDETGIIKEFSYDINSSYIKDGHFINLLIECKYRYEGTKWIFIPDNPEFGTGSRLRQGYPDNFMHINDHFCKTKSLITMSNDYYPYPLAPLCSKGVEILPNSNNSKTLTQAYTQIAYTFAENIIDNIEHQVYKLLGNEEFIFYNIPIIITTADIYLMKGHATIENIKKATRLDDVASKHDILVINYTAGKQLEKYNLTIFEKFINDIGHQKLSQNNHSFTKDIKHLFRFLSSCPRAFVLIKYTPKNEALEALFKYIDDYISPSKQTLKIIKKYNLDRDKKTKKIIKKLSKKHT